MAEFLINLQNRENPNAPSGLLWRRGDIVSIQRNDHSWGSKEGPPNFFVLKAPNIPLRVAKFFLERPWRNKEKEELGDDEIDYQFYGRSLFRYNPVNKILLNTRSKKTTHASEVRQKLLYWKNLHQSGVAIRDILDENYS